MATNISNPISQANENNTGFLDDFQDDILDYLYNLEPPADNLFWAGNFQTFATSSIFFVINLISSFNVLSASNF